MLINTCLCRLNEIWFALACFVALPFPPHYFLTFQIAHVVVLFKEWIETNKIVLIIHLMCALCSVHLSARTSLTQNTKFSVFGITHYVAITLADMRPKNGNRRIIIILPVLCYLLQTHLGRSALKNRPKSMLLRGRMA